MKTYVKPMFFFSIFLFPSSLFCYSAFSRAQKDSSYFPLAVGIQWTYQCAENSYIDTVTVADTQRVNDKLYYAIKEGGYRYNWFRKDSDKVYIVDTASVRLDTANIKEYMVYDFSADIGWSWEVPLLNDNSCEYGGTVSLTGKSDTIITPAGTFDKCCNFARTLPCRDAGRYKEWFAPGIGRAAYEEESFAGMRHFFMIYSNIITDVDDYEKSRIVSEFKLLQNYPNPFNPETVISYKLTMKSRITLKIYDMLGREAAVLADGIKPAGTYFMRWNASNHASGMYFCRLNAGNFTQTIKLNLIR